jgi:hypothetical protein
MVRIDASRIVAVVQHELSLRDGAVDRFPHLAVISSVVSALTRILSA